MRFLIAVLAAAAGVAGAVTSGPGCGGGADAGGDAHVDGGDVCGAGVWSVCRGSVMDGGCGPGYDPGCPACVPASGTSCPGSLHCGYCRGGWFDPSDWTMATCRVGRWDVWRTHCDPPRYDGGFEAEADADAGAEVGVDDGLDAETDPGDAGGEVVPSDADEHYTSWVDCGWTDGAITGSCMCDGLGACEGVAGGVWEPLGSHEIRVCARGAGSCDVAFFREVEGGGTAYRCTIPTSGTCGFDEARDCEAVFTCNLLMGDCPPGVVPTNVIPCDLVFDP